MDGDAEIYGTATTYSTVTTGKSASDAFLEEDVNLLFDGSLDEVVYSGSSAFENVKIHFDKIMDADSVNVYADSASASDVKGFEVYASMDGESYDFVAAYENNEDASYEIKKHTLSLPGTVYAKDIKVVIEAKDGAKIDVAEIEVFGKPATNAKTRKTSYSYETEVPFKTAEDIIAQDSGRKLLSDGLTSTSVTSSGDYVSIIYDLGGFYQLEDVTVTGNHGGFELLSSPDGYNYFSAGFYAASGGVATAWGRAENNAKFAKLVFRKPDSSDIILSEIELYARELMVDTSAVTPRVTVKPNNIIYIDWSDYKSNAAQSIYIEKTYFDSIYGLSPKTVYVNQSGNGVTSVTQGFCTYAGLEPDSEYYVAVTSSGSADKAVTPVKIKTNSAVGGDTLSGIFCVNEYDGGAHIQSRAEIEEYIANGASIDSGISQAEIDAIPENDGVNAKVAKLLSDMEVISKNRHWRYGETLIKPYLARGISWLPETVGTSEDVSMLNRNGIYTFGVANEPEIAQKYREDGDLFGQEFSAEIEQSNATLKGVTPKGVLYAPTLCGTDVHFNRLGKLYEHNSDMAEQYDILDIHLYTKKVDDESERIEDAESICVPENVANKVDMINDYLAGYGDSKDIVSTEIGWSRHVPEDSIAMAVTEEQQAQYIVRAYLTGILSGIKEIYLYAFQDEGYLSNEEVAAGETYIMSDYVDGAYKIMRSTPSRQHQYGIVDWYGNPHKGYFAYYTLCKVLKDAYLVKEHTDIGTLNYGAEFYDEVKDKYVTALWNIDGDGSQVSITSGQDKLLKLDMYGNASYISDGVLDIGSSPVYIYSDLPLTIAN